MCWRGVTALALLGFPVACGGRVLGEPMSDESSSADAATMTKTTNQNKGGKGADNFDGTVALPDCVPGVLVSKVDSSALATSCPYLYSGRCYTTKVKACACACPNKAGTVCSSGFASLEGTTEVSCH